MAQVDGSQLMAEGLKEEGVDTIFYIMGGPNILLSMHAERLGIKLIDVRQGRCLYGSRWPWSGKPPDWNVECLS
jgi:hypothetical protein